jgi:endonuclease YncB( thermonuclease family)
MASGHRLVFATIALVAALAATPLAAAELIRGPATVIDGETLAIKGVTVRLFGIAAPARDQSCSELFERRSRAYPCGLHATAFLDALVADRTVICVSAASRPGRDMRARCYAGGRDLAEAMVAAGWAVLDNRAANLYVKAQERARLDQRGMWVGRFDSPAARGKGATPALKP